MPPQSVPCYVAKELSRLPPLSINCFDVTSLVKDMESVKLHLLILQESHETLMKAQLDNSLHGKKNAIDKLKCGNIYKACGNDGLSAEHFIHSDRRITILLSIFFL